ncbi:DUF4126 family protein [Conexibacter sp. DBS9H8]|uniref:DUF4126 family protein n=1 Tax=Conexibacter sp. DBS9H8 TaxID=2937801 RepID=UPI00200DD350|nr:DUF4126 family protein [Conexibacter sp. DBS9H8]
MHLLFDIFSGIGIAAAAGIRPFLPGLVAGLLGLADFGVHFNHSSFAFVGKAPFLIVVALAAVVLIALEASRRGALLDEGRGVWLSGLFGAAVGAIVFGGLLAHQHDAVWPGLVGGVLCAGAGVLAARPFLRRLRGRLDAEAAALGVPLIAEGAALLAALLSAVAPPAGIVVLLGLAGIWFTGRGREAQKYAGLRILR